MKKLKTFDPRSRHFLAVSHFEQTNAQTLCRPILLLHIMRRPNVNLISNWQSLLSSSWGAQLGRKGGPGATLKQQGLQEAAGERIWGDIEAMIMWKQQCEEQLRVCLSLGHRATIAATTVRVAPADCAGSNTHSKYHNNVCNFLDTCTFENHF